MSMSQRSIAAYTKMRPDDSTPFHTLAGSMEQDLIQHAQDLRDESLREQSVFPDCRNRREQMPLFYRLAVMWITDLVLPRSGELRRTGFCDALRPYRAVRGPSAGRCFFFDGQRWAGRCGRKSLV